MRVRVVILPMVLALVVLPQALATSPAASAPATRPTQNRPRPFLGGFLQETRVIYPVRHDGWEARGEHLYDEQALGASVRFSHKQHPNRWIDIYFYPAGMLDASQFEMSLQRELEALESAVQPGGYSEMEIGSPRSFSYRPLGAGQQKADKAKGRSVGLHAVRDGLRLNSAMTLQLEHLYYIKGRMSVADDDLSRRATRRRLEDFVRTLAERLTIVSSGDCWMPMPIEPLPADAKSQPHLATLGSDGKDEVVVTRDRVLAAYPESAQALVGMMLGMSMTDRLVPGCQPMEDLNHPVDEGMRELRLEYHAPADEFQGDAPGLRRIRAGIG